MSEIQAAIIDDEPLARLRLKRLLSEAGVRVVVEAEDGSAALAIAVREDIDIMFLDINMPQMNGVEAANQIGNELENPPAIIFCTAYDEYAIEAFKTNAVSYILKPFTLEDIQAAIAKVQNLGQLKSSSLERLHEAKTEIVIRTISESYKLALSDVAYFYSKDKSTFAKLISGSDMFVDQTLKTLDTDLEHLFVRTHRAYLVNVEMLERIFKNQDGWLVLLRGVSEELPVSRRHVSDVKSCFE